MSLSMNGRLGLNVSSARYDNTVVNGARSIIADLDEKWRLWSIVDQCFKMVINIETPTREDLEDRSEVPALAERILTEAKASNDFYSVVVDRLNYNADKVLATM